MLTPTAHRLLPPHTAADMAHSTHSTHSQHCGHTALPPGQKTNPRRRTDPTQTVYAHPFRRAQTQVWRKGTWKLVHPFKQRSFFFFFFQSQSTKHLNTHSPQTPARTALAHSTQHTHKKHRPCLWVGITIRYRRPLQCRALDCPGFGLPWLGLPWLGSGRGSAAGVKRRAKHARILTAEWRS